MLPTSASRKTIFPAGVFPHAAAAASSTALASPWPSPSW
jgi:hypothetical protein